MDLIVSLTQIAGAISAVTVIFMTAWKVHKFLNKMEKKFENYDKTLNENTIHILKMALLSEDLPITDRLNAGKRYLELGGNGYGKIIYDQLVESLQKEPPTQKH